MHYIACGLAGFLLYSAMCRKIDDNPIEDWCAEDWITSIVVTILPFVGVILVVMHALNATNIVHNAMTALFKERRIKPPRTEEDIWPTPSTEMRATPEFKAVMEAIHSWQIGVPEAYNGITGGYSNHAKAILDSLKKANLLRIFLDEAREAENATGPR